MSPVIGSKTRPGVGSSNHHIARGPSADGYRDGKILGELKERYQKIVDSDGTSNKFSTQQLAARINATTTAT